MTKKLIACCSACVALLASVLAVSLQAQGRTVLDKVYTSEQADRGAAQYEAHCAMCHEGGEPDASPPRGSAFVDHWREAPLDFLYSQIRTNMPGDAPGSLSPAVYVDVLAYLLRENGYPAGNGELTAEQTRGILFVGTDGPQPLPPSAMVRVVGCLAAAPPDDWNLAAATAPVRVRVGDKTSPAEVAESAATVAGTATYRLRNAEDFNVKALAGQRVQVKGVLNTQAGVATVSLQSLEGAGAGCGK
jgi:mono/diheme cytochrome c family protein